MSTNPEVVLSQVPKSALPEPPDDRPVSAGISTTTAATDLLETLGVLAIAAALPAWTISGYLTVSLIIAGIVFFAWARTRRTERASENELDLRNPQYHFTAGQLASLAKGGLPAEAANALSVIRPGDPVSRWQLLRLLSTEMGESRASETLPAVLRYASK